MFTGSPEVSKKRKMKELRVLQLYDLGFSSRKIASLVHLSLRDTTRFVNLASNKIKSPTVTSINDEIILEYSVIPETNMLLSAGIVQS
jgi:hypothetical protein